MNTFVSVLWLVVEIITFAAFAKIIIRAGFSIAWILVPLLPVVLTFVLFNQATSGSLFLSQDTGIVLARLAPAGYLTLVASMNTFRIPGAGVIFYIDLVSTLVAWLLFVVFAFSAWPAQDGGSSGRLRLKTTGASVTAENAPVPTVAPSKSNFNTQRFGRPATPAGASASPSSPVSSGAATVTTQGDSPMVYCAWCGNERAVNAQAIHHCGSKSRPVVYCTGCGTSLVPGAVACASCNLPVG